MSWEGDTVNAGQTLVNYKEKNGKAEHYVSNCNTSDMKKD